jgi:hypothetical protein
MNRNWRKWLFCAALAGSLSLGNGSISVNAENPQSAPTRSTIQQTQNDGRMELVAQRANHRRGRRHRRHHRQTT